MFHSQSHLLRDNPAQLNYGVAVADLTGDGRSSIVVAAFGRGNLVLQWDGSSLVNTADAALADEGRQAIGVGAADIDGDGREELYVLNTDTFAGYKRFGDRLFSYDGRQWLDLFGVPENRDVLNMTAGRSVACVDRRGTGRYGFVVANYGGPMRLYESPQPRHLHDVAGEAGLDYVTGGRALVSLPLVGPRMDVFAGNENSQNFLFRNNGDGTFEEMAERACLADAEEHARGIAVLDANQDGRFDVVYGNWEGPHRLFLQIDDGVFVNHATRLMAIPSRVRTVLAADFDNDGYEEIFFHNIGESNRMFAYRDKEWVAVDTGAALEPDGLGTGAAYGDFDGDGMLELLLSHGESGAQPLTLYRAAQNGNHWLRVQPLTAAGAPARGAVVRLTAGGRTQVRAVCAGSGYLCQMEPVAHFGLGTTERIERITITWPTGATATINAPDVRQTLRVPHP